MSGVWDCGSRIKRLGGRAREVEVVDTRFTHLGFCLSLDGRKSQIGIQLDVYGSKTVREVDWRLKLNESRPK